MAQPHAPFVFHDDVAFRPSVTPAAGTAHENDGGLQPLEGMEGGDAYFVAALRTRAFRLLGLLRIRGEEPAYPRIRVAARGRGNEGQHVVDAALAHPRDERRVIEVRDYALQQLGHAFETRFQAVSRQHIQQSRRLFAEGVLLLRRGEHRIIEIPLSSQRRDARELVLVEPAEVGEHEPSERDVLPRIVQHGEEADEFLFRPRGLLREYARVEREKLPDVGGKLFDRVIPAADEDGAVAVTDGGAVLLLRAPAQLVDLVPDELRLRVYPGRGRRARIREDVHLRTALELFAGGVLLVFAYHEVPLFCIVHAGGSLGHHLVEDAVDKVQHRVHAAEVGVELQRRPLSRLLIAPLAPEEDLRVGEAEAVDALLDVPHHEDVVAAHPADDEILHGVDVLIFVHKHPLEAAREFSGTHQFRGVELQVFIAHHPVGALHHGGSLLRHLGKVHELAGIEGVLRVHRAHLPGVAEEVPPLRKQLDRLFHGVLAEVLVAGVHAL